MDLAALADQVQFHFLPPCCSEHNRIERTWTDLHDNVTHYHTCGSMRQLKEVRDYLSTRDQQLQERYQVRHAA
jgi:transposase